MNGNKYLHLIKTIFITGFAFIINYGINLVLTPFITNNVGTEAYGFVSLAKQFAQYATIITTALNSFASRYITIEYHKGDKGKSNEYFNSVFFGDLALGSFICIIAFSLIAFLEKLINIPDDLIHDVKFLFLFVFINFWITTVFTVFSSAAFIVNKLDLVGLFKGLSYLTEAIVLYIIYVLFPAKVFFVGIGLIAASLIVAISNVWMSRKYTSDIYVQKKSFSLKAVKRLVLDGIWTSVNSLGNLLNNGLDLIVCNLLLSSLAMGQVAIAKTIDSIFHSLYQLVAQTFQPMFLKSYATNDRKKLLDDLKMSMKISGLFSNLAFAGFLALGLVYYELWIPNQDIILIYRITIITILTSISAGPMNPLYYIYTLTVKKVIPCIITLIGGVCNVVGMYFLITYTNMGVYAIVWTTAIVMSVINFITNPLYMAYSLKLPWHIFYPNIIKNVISCLVLSIAFKGFTMLYLPDSWITLILCIIIYACIGSFLHFVIVFGKEDWSKLIKYVRIVVTAREK